MKTPVRCAIRSLIGPLALAVLMLPVPARPAASRWTPDGMPVCTAAGDQFIVGLCPDGAGGFFLTWIDERLDPQNDDVYLQRLTADGEIAPGWPVDGVGVCTLPREQIVTGIASDGSGGVLLAWDDARRFKDHDVYADRVLGYGLADPDWPVNGRALHPPDLSVKSGPRIAPDGNGGAFVAWNNYRGSGGDGDLYAQHVLANGALDPAWPDSGVVVCGAPGLQIVSEALADGAGGVFVVWTDLRPPVSSSAIYAQHLSSSGTPAAGWTSGGVAVATGAGGRDHPAAVADGQGGLVVAWRDFRVGSRASAYAVRLNSEALVAEGWTLNGTAIAVGSVMQGDLSLVSDGEAGAIIAYPVFEDSGPEPAGRPETGLAAMRRPTIEGAVAGSTTTFAIRLSSRGAVAPGWPTSGARLSGTNVSGSPQAVPDGSGGAVVAWTEGMGDSAAIRSVRVRADGTRADGWPQAGAILMREGEIGYGPLLLENNGGAFAAWNDLRNGNNDIYAQSVTADGTVAPGYLPPPPPVTVSWAVYPNPVNRIMTAVLQSSAPQAATARVFDPGGRLVRVLDAGAVRKSGEVMFSWDATDGRSRRVPAGTYLLRAEDGAQSHTERIVVLPRK